MRFAIYFTPPKTHPLTLAAERWLGRSAFSGSAVERPPALAEALEGRTIDAARYGFHATLTAPFRLAQTETEQGLSEALAGFAAAVEPFSARLGLASLDGFLALVPEPRSARIEALERGLVTDLARFRAPPDAAELARRRPERLTPAQRRNLDAHGYPYVLDEFRFHMTLTDRLDEADRPRLRWLADSHFGPLLAEPLDFATLALFVEPAPGAPFVVRSLHALGRHSERKPT